jgi:predicted AAA+ superfamily ATPase
MDNYQLVTKGFSDIYRYVAPFVAIELKSHFKENWWNVGVLDVLREEQKKDLPSVGDWATLVDSLDVARCLVLIDVLWNEIFKKKLSLEHRNWVKELITTRNKWAHKGGGDLSSDNACRALDTMARLLEQIDSESTEEIRGLLRQIRYGTSQASTSAKKIQNIPVSTELSRNVLNITPQQGLSPWRFTIEPHPDVAQGLYLQAEFAADLFQVFKGTSLLEYQDPVDFFGRTYITEGMKGLLIQAIKRVSGKGGEPVIQLKTSFGGGKTHSMLALYHLLRGSSKLENIPYVKDVIKGAGVDKCPKAKVAVLVGTALNPSKTRRPPNFPGITIRTLWGEIAAQLAEQAGNPKLYEIIKDADKSSVPPGSEALLELFDSCGQCVILIDELVAYARVLYGIQDLPAGTFDSLLTFVQQLTEAARASTDSIVVAAIPESNIEIGGEAGQKALASIEHTFGRMEAIWKPVGVDEGFEIVRRRLFLPVQDKQNRDDVCRAFSEMYRQNFQDFPAECKELAYLERLKSCYPIHPEVFERLYGDWATLERFQKTRGVLRLMASVIHDLWIKNDHSLLIMPGSVPLDNINVREELTRYLPEGWNSVIEKEIDGTRSVTYQTDIDNTRFTKYMAGRRVGRTIFLGSAPSVREQAVRGLEDVRLRLGVVQPGEQISVFNDSLARLIDSLSYLYSNNRRYWYDLRPNLKRTVEDRAQQIPADDVEMEIERRVKAFRDRAEFTAVHNCPVSSLDVPDEQSVRLVVLPSEKTYKQKVSGNKAEDFIYDILSNRGNSGRLYKNMLVFVGPDTDVMAGLKPEVRRYLAWKSVLEDIGL